MQTICISCIYSTHSCNDASSMKRMKYDEASVIVRQTVADNIRAIRLECGHNQAKFAEMINVNRSYINQIELGKENISLDILVKIADGLDRPIIDFFHGLEDCPPRKLIRKPANSKANSCNAFSGKTFYYHFAEFLPQDS